MILDVIKIGAGIIDKIIPDKAEAAKAKLDLITLEQQGELKAIEVQLSAIVAEAQSSDPWTSRARPSFLWVVYILILSAIPMGFLSAADPELAKNVIAGFSMWLAAIPEPIVTLFGVGYLGYTGARSLDKRNKLS